MSAQHIVLFFSTTKLNDMALQEDKINHITPKSIIKYGKQETICIEIANQINSAHFEFLILGLRQ